MPEKYKILKTGERICLFCGEKMQEKWEEYTQYYECDCKDAIKVREIRKKIDVLKLEMPNHKFEIVEKSVLLNLEE